MCTGPARCGRDEDGQGSPTGITKLEMRVGQNRRGSARTEIDRLLVISVFAPQLTVALKRIPNLLYTLMADRAGNGLRRKCTLANAATLDTREQARPLGGATDYDTSGGLGHCARSLGLVWLPSATRAA
jgi:hypothetical protein